MASLITKIIEFINPTKSAEVKPATESNDSKPIEEASPSVKPVTEYEKQEKLFETLNSLPNTEKSKIISTINTLQGVFRKEGSRDHQQYPSQDEYGRNK